jgi:hypothetical protein
MTDCESEGERFAVPSSVVLKRLGIELDQFKIMVAKAHSWINDLSDTLNFD